MTPSPAQPDPAQPDVKAVLAAHTRVAVLGASTRPSRAGFYVPRYLAANGYRIFPVNPDHVGERLGDAPFVARLGDLAEPVEIVEVFRRPDALMDHLPEILALDPLPAVVWLQAGIRHPAFASALADAGIGVVQDRCMLVDHRNLF